MKVPEFIGIWAPDAMLVDGFDDCLVGVVDGCAEPTRAVYDKDAMLEKMVKRDGMSLEEAYEYFEHNIIGAYVGETTPVFLSKLV